MITLVYPKSGELSYFVYAETLIGPMDRSGHCVGDRMQIRSVKDTIHEERGLYLENHVTHRKIEAELMFHAANQSVTVTPQSGYPYYSVLSAVSANKKKVSLTAPDGFFRSGEGLVVRYPVTGSSYYIHRAYLFDGQIWHIWTVTAYSTAPTKISSWNYAKLHTITPKTVDSVQFSVTRQSIYSGSSIQTEVDWSKEQTFSTISSFRSSTVPIVTYATTTSSALCYDVANIATPPSAMTVVDELQDTVMYLEKRAKYPNSKHYGDLASEASSMFIANHVNMMAFIKDLRHPTDLIPKLRNFSKLKGMRKVKRLSDNYLTAKYGVLPTVSDLSEIWKAMMGVKPYVDRNGFQTHSASYRSSYQGETYVTSLEQHLKLAIGNEDSALESAITDLESMGSFPTLENVWDLIPYSFVIDWFVNIGGLLERADSYGRICRFNVRYTTMSDKWIFSTKVEGAIVPFFGTVKLVHYHRWVSDQCPVPPLTLQSQPEATNHWLEAGALIIQRSKP